MLEETRLHRICALLSTLNRVSTEQIVQHLGVSRETVRRDVLKLEAMGALRRVHGGIVSTAQQAEPPLSVRNTVREKEKRDIARAAVQLLTPGQTLFIDAGSTTSLLADELLSMPGLTIITNSLNVALKLSGAETTLEHEVILLGGSMGPSQQATCGELTVSEINRYRADVALLSPVGVSARDGASSFAHREAAVAGAMVACAKTRIILADSSKIGVTSRVIYAPTPNIDMVITDAAGAGLAEWQRLHNSGPQAIIA
ncbi:DeoR/GlpR transcriptional regulator [Pluralibacter gergoviae]|uniref:DeoR/GlpR transcriptional regulator n=2 Tax=Pluralibacter gergoviae TaxID=61647 RepID=A0AAI9GLH6_PLUGE|nr:DeoR/GlpR family DNA-binding transcription regulator [Pluralibacter gergoviae]EKV0917543.1 DeoR/GlpR transcriptional regulator [Pluralibacter gergoviae]EKV0930153.1 DeoR/GlpR transcriptional regulator [Pluralibacter gergoviae]EKV6248932.1 DeoR/GlpR transcriptional regulator [Pluralibacter gergoviae]EKV9910510.1 DeoR/GlpR transcriptional regulator [Pluralibacter gergoviae]EKW7275248.1 DeoR/GlpR transcriptional regulator [Pluralibacter gergoviae]